MAKSSNQLKEDLAKEIKILAEVEKIWILYDIDNSERLDFNEVSLYLKEMAFSNVHLTDEQLRAIFDSMDENNDGEIEKQEMANFVRALMNMDDKLRFRRASDFNNIYDKD